MRTILLWLGIAFCAVFGILTLVATVRLGFGLTTYGDLLALGFQVVSLLVIAMIGIGLYGASQSPPDE